MEKALKIYIFIFSLVFSNSVRASPNDELLGQKVSASVQLCYSVEYLQKKYCKQLEKVDIKSCSDEAISILPMKFQNLMYKKLPELLTMYNFYAKEAVESGYNKTLVEAKGNRNNACIAYWNLILDTRKERMSEARNLVK